jgi:hypothetical protein
LAEGVSADASRRKNYEKEEKKKGENVKSKGRKRVINQVKGVNLGKLVNYGI